MDQLIKVTGEGGLLFPSIGSMRIAAVVHAQVSVPWMCRTTHLAPLGVCQTMKYPFLSPRLFPFILFSSSNNITTLTNITPQPSQLHQAASQSWLPPVCRAFSTSNPILDQLSMMTMVSTHKMPEGLCTPEVSFPSSEHYAVSRRSPLPPLKISR